MTRKKSPSPETTAVGPADDPFVPCSIKALESDQLLAAARFAQDHFPPNGFPQNAGASFALASLGAEPWHLASLIGKAWRPGTVLPTGFLEPTPRDLQARILSHLNAWNAAGANIRFAAAADPWIRITREGDGYWAYLGTDVMGLPAGEPTICLQAFTMAMPESEFRRVVRHEGGHLLSFPHEHARREIVNRLDPAKTVAVFEAWQGWSEATIRQQILIPLDERSVTGTPHAQEDSILCYGFPGTCTRDGRPIVGGRDLTPGDIAFARKVYPGRLATVAEAVC